MNKTNVITARLTSEASADLDRLANYFDRSRSWLIAKAVEKYVREESEFFAFLKEGEDAIDRGDYLTHDEMMAEIRQWQRDRKTAA